MNIHAGKYVEKGYAVTTLRLSYDEQTRRKICKFGKKWEHATKDNCMQEFVNANDNAIALLTGDQSDLLVIDADLPKDKEKDTVADGLTLLQQLMQDHGLYDKVPRQRTGSGGLHLFFSITKSVAEGLISASNRAKIHVNGVPTTIDVRGDGGVIICAPSKYKAADSVRQYTFIVPICAREDLQAAPKWLIDILNKDTCMREKHKLPTVRNARICVHNADDSFYELVKPTVEVYMNNSIATRWQRTNGFDFAVTDTSVKCICCGSVHTSNNFRCRQVLTSCYSLRNYSTSCTETVLEYEKHPVIATMLAYPTTDTCYVNMMRTIYTFKGWKIVASGDSDKSPFYIFNGNRWMEEPNIGFEQELMYTSIDIIGHLARYVNTQLATCEDHDTKEKLKHHAKQFHQAMTFVQRAHNITNVTRTAKRVLWDVDFASKLDTNHDLLGVANGVIDLRTGALRQGTPDDMISRVLTTEYKGLGYGTQDIDAFMKSIFEDDDLEHFVQVVLGYGITGHTTEQIMAVFTGSGSNGKGIMCRILHKLLGPVAQTMSPDCILKRGRPPAKGAPTPYMAMLKGARIAICDETPDDAILDEEAIKRATGQGVIEARFLGCNPICFEATHLPIILTNSIPKINITDNAMLRRLLIIPFDYIFKNAIDMDEANSHHKLIDKKLAERLLQEHTQEQLLTWLAHGAKEWYESGFPKIPQRALHALADYISDNDTLQEYIDEYCECDDRFEVATSVFTHGFNKSTGDNITHKKVMQWMTQKGFTTRQARIAGTRTMVYQGIRITDVGFCSYTDL